MVQIEYKFMYENNRFEVLANNQDWIPWHLDLNMRLPLFILKWITRKELKDTNNISRFKSVWVLIKQYKTGRMADINVSGFLRSVEDGYIQYVREGLTVGSFDTVKFTTDDYSVEFLCHNPSMIYKIIVFKKAGK